MVERADQRQLSQAIVKMLSVQSEGNEYHSN